jgi:hypothetical protein
MRLQNWVGEKFALPRAEHGLATVFANGKYADAGRIKQVRTTIENNSLGHWSWKGYKYLGGKTKMRRSLS